MELEHKWLDLNVKEIKLYLHTLLKQWLKLCSHSSDIPIICSTAVLSFNDTIFFFTVLLAAGAVQMSGGNRRIKLLLHLSNHHWRPVHQQQKDRDALSILSGHTTRKVSFNSLYDWFIRIRHQDRSCWQPSDQHVFDLNNSQFQALESTPELTLT